MANCSVQKIITEVRLMFWIIHLLIVCQQDL